MASTFSVRADVRQVQATLDSLGRTQLPYATSVAINRTLEEVQRVQLASIGRSFEVRRPDFAKRSVKINRADFATKRNPVGRIGIDGDRSEIYARHEVAGLRRPFAPNRLLEGGLAIPRVGGIAKKYKRSVTPEALRPTALLNNRLLSLRAFVRPFKNDPTTRGLFVVDRVHEAKLGAKRKGRSTTGAKIGTRDVRRARPQLVYTLKPAVPLTNRLHFLENAEAVIRTGFVPNLRAEIARALANPKR